MKSPLLYNRKGITFVEVIVAIGVLLTLLGIAAVSFVPVRGNLSLDATISTLISDIKSQQIKSMAGDTEGTGANQTYGIYFEQDQYTLFRGSSYLPSGPSNFSVELDDTISISSIALPSSSLIFSAGEGAVVGFSPTQNSIGLTDSVAGTQKTIIINRYGVITSAN